MRQGINVLRLTVMVLACMVISTQQAHSTDCQLVVEFDRQYMRITKAEVFDVPSEYQIDYGSANFQASTNGRIRGVNIAEKWTGKKVQNWNRRDGEPVVNADVYILQGEYWVKTSQPWTDYSTIGTEMIVDFGKVSCSPNEKKKRLIWNVYILPTEQP